MSDRYGTKAVQAMLREYCTAHICECSGNLPIYMINTSQIGFMTGKKNQVIPWGSLIKDPTSWILAESIPDGFEWKDPSKIQVGEVFRLLDHWRDRGDQGLEPLSWVPTSPLFKHTDPSSKPVQTFRTAQVLDPHDSDEEVFVLPDSDELDEENNSHMSHTTSDHVSAVGGPPGDRWKTVDQDGEAVHKPSDYLDTIDRSSGDGGPMNLEPLTKKSSDHVEGHSGESSFSLSIGLSNDTYF